MTGVSMIRMLALFAALVCAAPAMAQSLPAGLDKQNVIVIDTTKGRVVIKLRADLAPKHAERIKLLAREGYYNNVPFHRVIEGFMAQTGDGKNFNGTGGSKYPNLAAEFSNVPYTRGIVGMARTSDPNSANSQFFIMFADGSSRGGVGHGRGRQAQARRTRGRSRQDGEGAGRVRYQVSGMGRRLGLAHLRPTSAHSHGHHGHGRL
jgi:peptidylprolyl isomerase